MRSASGNVCLPRGRLGVSLVELLVVIACILLLAAILSPCLFQARERARTVSCASNLHQIGLAISMYETDNGERPPLALSPSLLPYLANEEALLHCPSDSEPGDSYTPFYIPRKCPESDVAIVTCPRHPEGYLTAVLYYQGSVKKHIAQPVFADGEEVDPGALINSGTVEFADGTIVTVHDTTIELLFSVADRGDGLYSAIRVPAGLAGEVEVDAAPGTRFEVVTPACIAGVRGTRFRVEVQWQGPSRDAPVGLPGQPTGQGGWGWTKVEVLEGSVWVRTMDATSDLELAPGPAQFFTFR